MIDEQEYNEDGLKGETRLQNLRLMGIKGLKEYSKVVKEMQDTIVNHANQAGSGFAEYEIISIRKVVSEKLWAMYTKRRDEVELEAGFANEKMLFHGSNSVYDIAKTGFEIKYADQNGMFGPGIYFAEHSSKSNQYVFGYMGGTGCLRHSNINCFECQRQMLLCRVTLGTELKMTSAQKYSEPPPGHHSVAGVPSQWGLRYPEYIIYRGDQAFPEYLITYKIVK